MSDFMSRASLAGAVDLSSLRKAEPTLGKTAPPTNPISDAGMRQTNQSNQIESLKLPSLIVQCDETNLRDFIEVSNQLPVIMEFYAGWSEQSKALSPKLMKLTQSLAGRVLLIQVDFDANPNIAKVFKIETIPTVVALLRGQPVPLFNGDQSEVNLQVVFDRVLEVAGENGLNGLITVDVDAAEATPALPPRHQAAFEAIDAGNYAEAAKQYEEIIQETPSDALAVAGLAHTKLLIRTEGIDFEKVLGSDAVSIEEVILKADACFAVGHQAEGFSVILTRFATVFGPERETLRKHLLELFLICPADLPALLDARRKLAALLY